MTSFDDREKSFEKKFAHDEERTFKINARRNKLLGQWAATLLGKSDADAYAKEVVAADFEKQGDDDVLQKVLKDVTAAGVVLTEKDLRIKMNELLVTAEAQIEAGQ